MYLTLILRSRIRFGYSRIIRLFSILILVWCAKLYGNDDYGGWNYEVTQTNSANMPDNYDNAVTSIKVRTGCIFKGYDEKSKVTFLKEILGDIPKFGTLTPNINNQISSYSCSCGGEFEIYNSKKNLN